MAKILSVRRANPSDYEELGRVMYDSVRNGSSLYSDAERAAWVPMPRVGSEWNARLQNQIIFLGETGQEVLGFISLASKGYIDFAYIRPSARGTGLFRKLYDAIESTAIESRVTLLWVHASLMAQPAFAAMGFSVVQRETVHIGESSLDRFVMEKVLHGPHPTSSV